MSRYFYPDGPDAAYDPQGMLGEIRPGDFFKCATCRRMQRYTGTFWLNGEAEGRVRLNCADCAPSRRPQRWDLPPLMPRRAQDPTAGMSAPPALRGQAAAMANRARAV